MYENVWLEPDNSEGDAVEGMTVGVAVGCGVGFAVGCALGAAVIGTKEGCAVGFALGTPEGCAVGFVVGNAVGDAVADGAAVEDETVGVAVAATEAVITTEPEAPFEAARL